MQLTEKLLNLDPNEILIRDNIRYGLKPYRVDSLADNILQVGGVREPILVEELSEPIDGKRFVLQVGNYRHAAVVKLNTEQKADLTLPARIVPALSDQERLIAQVAENQERENMSPMDRAIAIQKMTSAGISKMDIRKAFSSPGGRKGIKVQPASNSHINMLMSFLDFPKDIQRKIHDGVIGIGAAYKLTKYPKDKWTDILDTHEAERIKEIEREEKEEETYLTQTKKASEAEQEQEKTAKALAEAKELAEKATALAKEKASEVTQALQTKLTSKGEERKQAQEHFKAAEAELKSAQEIADKATKELGKLEDRASTAADKAKAARERLEAARKAKAAKTTTKVTGADVEKAAKKAGASDKTVKLNGQGMRDAVGSLTVLSKPLDKFPKTAAIGALLEQCFEGKITDGQLHVAIAKVVGELPATTPSPAVSKKK